MQLLPMLLETAEASGGGARHVQSALVHTCAIAMACWLVLTPCNLRTLNSEVQPHSHLDVSVLRELQQHRFSKFMRGCDIHHAYMRHTRAADKVTHQLLPF